MPRRRAHRLSPTAARPTDVSVRIAGGGEGEVRRYELKQLQPGQHELSWDGLTEARKAAPDGRYKVHVGATGSQLAEAGRLTLHGRRFPIREAARHPRRDRRLRRAPQRRSQPRGLRRHRALWEPLIAAAAARSSPPLPSQPRRQLRRHLRSTGGRTYRYSHLTRPAEVAKGERVFTGQVVGFVGQTGNAASTPCHLHAEIRARGGRFLDPEPFLRSWSRFS